MCGQRTMPRWNQITDAVKRLGWQDGTLYLVSHTLQLMSKGFLRFHKYYLVAQPVPARPFLSHPTSELRIERIASEHPLVAQFPRPQAVLERRFADGAVCIAASKRGKFIGFIWLQYGKYEEDEVRCHYLPSPVDRAVWDYDVYIEPIYRKGRMFLRLWDAAHDYLRRSGIEWTVSRISAFNRESLSSHRRLGTVPLGKASFLCAGRAQVALFSIPPVFRVSCTTRSSPPIVLNTSVARLDPNTVSL